MYLSWKVVHRVAQAPPILWGFHFQHEISTPNRTFQSDPSRKRMEDTLDSSPPQSRGLALLQQTFYWSKWVHMITVQGELGNVVFCSCSSVTVLPYGGAPGGSVDWGSDFGLGHDPRVLGLGPAWGALLSKDSVSPSTFALPLACSFSFSRK